MKVGFIGCGNMASAMIGGIIAKDMYQSENIIVSDVLESSLEIQFFRQNTCFRR